MWYACIVEGRESSCGELKDSGCVEESTLIDQSAEGLKYY